MLPSVLKNHNSFVDGTAWTGLVDEIKLPVLKRKTEEYRGGGMNGPADIDLGQEKLEAEITLGGLVKDALKKYGAVGVNGTLIRFAGAYQSDDTEAVMATEVVMRGRFNEVGLGDAKAGGNSKPTLKASLTYYKLTIDNEVLIEIDTINFIENIGGKDMLEAQRKAIGLA